ncbi:MAG: DUF962 domain-containing protein [Candidatus Hydrogenedentes bacterium]|nr:DUF962 domain-containing protein [Candidatus Hydrogenedentota bacterium]
MKTIEDHMSFYEAYHKHPLNKLTHFVGIPAIIFSILIPMSWLGVSFGGNTITLAIVFVFVVLGYYFRLDMVFGLAMAAFIVPLLALAHHVAQNWTLGNGALLFLAAFAGGWILQLAGHVVFEKRRPALADNLFQLVIGPIFLCAELFFLLGFKREMHQKVVELSKAYALEQPTH